VAVFDLLIYYS